MRRRLGKHFRASTLLALAALVGVAMLVTACGSDDSDSSSDTAAAESDSAGGGGDAVANAEAALKDSETQPAEIATADLSPITPKSDATLFYISCDISVEGCKLESEGAEKAAAAIGYDLELCHVRNSDPESGAACFANAVNAKPDVIIVSGVNEALAGSGYADVKKAGIPLISSFSGNKPSASTVSVAEGPVCKTVGEEQGQWVVAASEGSANVLIPYTNEFPCTAEAKDGLTAVLSKCEDCSSKAFNFNLATATNSLPQKMQAELLADPNIDAVIGTFNLPATIAAETVEGLGKTEIKIGGMFGGAPNVDQIKAGGPQVAESRTPQVEPSWAAVDLAARLILGEAVPKNVELSTMTVTVDNIGEFPSGYEGAVDFEAQYKEQWGKK